MKFLTQIVFVCIVTMHFQGFSQEKEFNDDPDILSAIKALKSPQVYQAMLSRSYKP